MSPVTTTPGWSERSASRPDVPAPRAGLDRSLLVTAAGAALAGLLHATAGGAVVVGGLALAVPEVVEIGNPLEAVAQAMAFGLASLRVPLESGGVEGTFAPLSGLLLTLWGLASAVRKGVTPSRAVGHVIATGAAFSLTCAGAAVGAGALTGLDASIPWAAVAGLGWGALGAAAGTYLPVRRQDPEPREVSGPAHPGPLGGASLAPALLTVCVAFGLAAAWFLVAALVGLSGASPRELAGGFLLALAVAPNAAAALVAVGLGSSVDVVLDGTLLADPLRDSLSLRDGSPYVLTLVLAPIVASLAGGRLAAALTPPTRTLVRGLRNGGALGIALVLAGWAGSLGAAAGAAGDRVSVRLGFSAIVTFALAIAWGVAGAYLGPLLPRGGRGSRVDRT